ncbi:MAG TPA: glycosyltransferase family 2 protein [Candidatus Nanoarchaeia archaeon]|nr:glycosyltransferase family 2 protein [Candidatus Nanoarchaeia archaeon]
MTKTDILIVHLNGESVIKNCLESIKKYTKDFDIYILLNGTTDKSEEVINKTYSKSFIFKTDKIIGFAEASNFLAKKAKSDYAVFLNNDTEVSKGWLSEMLKIINKKSNYIACQPKIKSYSDREMFEYAGAAGGFIDKYGYPFCRGRIFDSLEKDKGQYNDEIRVFWGCGVCLVVKRREFLDIGGFDKNFFMYGEETDFCWRANIYGKEIIFCPKSVIYHIGSYSVNKEKINLKKDYLHSRNHILLLIKNYSFTNLVRILPVRLLLEIISAVRFFPNKTIAAILTFFILPFDYIFTYSKKRKEVQSKRKVSDKELEDLKLIYKRSIALDYFLDGKNKFSNLRFK